MARSRQPSSVGISRETTMMMSVSLGEGVQINLNIVPSAQDMHGDGLLAQNVKLREEADGLYHDFAEVQQQSRELRVRNAFLETKCKDFQKTLMEKEKLLCDVTKQIEDLTTLTRTQKDSKSSESSCCPGETSLPFPVEEETGTVITSSPGTSCTLQETENLKVQLEQALMLTDIWHQNCKAAQKKNQHLERRLRVLEETHQGEMSSTELEDQEIGGQTFQRFHRLRCQGQECSSCHQIVGQDALEEPCLYHPRRPISSSMWRRWFPDTAVTMAFYDHRLWPCCDKFSKTTPRGCQIGRHRLT